MRFKIKKIVFFRKQMIISYTFKNLTSFFYILDCKLSNLVVLLTGLNPAGDIYPAYICRDVNVCTHADISAYMCLCSVAALLMSSRTVL